MSNICYLKVGYGTQLSLNVYFVSGPKYCGYMTGKLLFHYSRVTLVRSKKDLRKKRFLGYNIMGNLAQVLFLRLWIAGIQILHWGAGALRWMGYLKIRDLLSWQVVSWFIPFPKKISFNLRSFVRSSKKNCNWPSA